MKNLRPRQTDMILDYIEKFGSITPVEAMRDLGVMRLAARIADIEKRGILIKHETETGRNRFGEETHYSRYSFG